jgi:hypothetical protein
MDDVASISCHIDLKLDPNPVLGALSLANSCSGYSVCRLHPFLPSLRHLMSIRQRRPGHRVKEALSLANAARVRSKHSKVKCYPLSNLDIKAPDLSAPLDLVDTQRVHCDMYCGALDISLLEACFNFNSTSTHHTRIT